MINNVSVNNKICCGCGVCESICPQNAISIERNKKGFLRPLVSKTCINCGLCLKSCPTDKMEQFNHNDFAYLYYGHSNNENLRYHAASGGVTTELLSYLLSKKIVDYVIVSQNNRLQRTVNGEIIRDKEKLIKNAGSNYCPVNIGSAISQIKKNNGKCAIVCLPCVARGIELLRKFDLDLNNKIKFIFSLVCNHVPSYNGTTYYLKKNHIRRPLLIKYRGEGWYSNIKIITKKKTHLLPWKKFYKDVFCYNFWQESCVNCVDHFGKYADASFGDADFIKYRYNQVDMTNHGETMVFINNSMINNILMNMKEERLISIFTDFSKNDVDKIFDEISQKKAFLSSPLECNYTKLLKRERRNKLKDYVRSLMMMAKRIFHKDR